MCVDLFWHLAASIQKRGKRSVCVAARCKHRSNNSPDGSSWIRPACVVVLRLQTAGRTSSGTTASGTVFKKWRNIGLHRKAHIRFCCGEVSPANVAEFAFQAYQKICFLYRCCVPALRHLNAAELWVVVNQAVIFCIYTLLVGVLSLLSKTDA